MSTNELIRILISHVNKLEEKIDVLSSQVVNGHAEKKQTPNTKVSSSVIDKDLLCKVALAKTTDDIVNLGFKFENDIFSCKVCPRNKIRYVEGEIKFYTLKQRIKRHLWGDGHLLKINDVNLKAKVEEKIETNNAVAGLACGRIVYKLVKRGRPDIDYETDILLLKKCGAFVGDVQHSRKFVSSLRPHLAAELQNLCSKFLSKPLDQTGFRPPVALTADCGTYKHHCRQFVGIFISLVMSKNTE